MKIMMLGSGPDRIGKTGELDCFMVKALRFLKKEGHELVVVDQNPATLASSGEYAFRVYLEPLTLEFLEKIIANEEPEAMIYGFGGCLATRLLIFLDREGVLLRYGVKVLGTTMGALKRLMDWEILKKELRDAGVPLMQAAIAVNVDDCLRLSRNMGFPLILRPSFALEGIGGYLAYNTEEVEQLGHFALNLSPVHEVVLERAPADWVQMALECLHDPGSPGKVHLVGTFEALDGGVNIHPANSILAAPAPTMKGALLERALDIASRVASATQICGSFQVRFALPPNSGEPIVLRVIHGLNRFSSFLSTWRNVPLSEINASLFLGTPFDDIRHKLDIDFNSDHENPELIAVRLPVFPEELQHKDIIDATMRSLGAAFFLDRSLPKALVRAIDFMHVSGLFRMGEEESLDLKSTDLIFPSPQRILAVVRMLERNKKVLERFVGLNSAFLPVLKEVASISKRLHAVSGGYIPTELITKAKLAGFSDKGAGHLAGLNEEIVSEARKRIGLYPQLTSVQGYYQRKETDFGYISYPAKKTRKNRKRSLDTILILGPGPYRIGLGTEVDQVLLQTALGFKERGKRVVLINNNPDAVSQDLEVMDAIYLGPSSLEMIGAVIEKWEIGGLVHQFCFNIPEGLEQLLKEQDVQVLGTPLTSLHSILDVTSFWETIKKVDVPVLSHKLVSDPRNAVDEAASFGYPALIRLSNERPNPAAEIIYDKTMLQSFLDRYRNRISGRTPLFMQVFEEGMTSFEAVALCDGQDALILAFVENIEEYGVHSGDCASTIPTLSLGEFHKAASQDALTCITRHFNIVGHLQLEMLVKGEGAYVTAAAPFPSRNLPFIEKAIGQPVHGWVSQLLSGERLGHLGVKPPHKSDGWYVKESTFPFSRFPELDPLLSPRMCSTGQVIGIDKTFGKAYIKSQMADNLVIPSRGKVFLSVRDPEKEAVVKLSQKLLELDFSIVSTEGTAAFLMNRGIMVDRVYKVSGGRPNIIDLIKNGKISLVVNIPGGDKSKQEDRVIRRATVHYNIPFVSTVSGAFSIIQGIEEIRKSPLTIALSSHKDTL